MQILAERGCGLDVHQATVVACLLILGKDGKVHKQVRTFATSIFQSARTVTTSFFCSTFFTIIRPCAPMSSRSLQRRIALWPVKRRPESITTPPFGKKARNFLGIPLIDCLNEKVNWIGKCGAAHGPSPK
jgi:hypothetical protein